jgi:cysteine-rich repeat protein
MGACPLNCRSARCGDGYVWNTEGGTEECDDGNSVNGDACDTNCTTPRCGNGAVDPGEQCDDGNTNNSDGCDNACKIPGCGNGAVDPGEQCDDGNATNGDGCDNNCTTTACGNGIRTGTEQCDDGNTTNGDTCEANCTTPACRNNILDPGEMCDDGNSTNGDGCDNNCTDTACLNGIVTTGEQCDDGNSTNGDGCDNNCTVTACGNGVRSGSEACDDGNGTNGDMCDNNCTFPACGNGELDPGEQCDDGNTQDGDGCESNCTSSGCGNSVVDPGEDCDDGVNALTGMCPDCHNPYSSCALLHGYYPSAPSDVYYIDAGTGPFEAYCEMSLDGGGWTLALKSDGTQQTFAYDSGLWYDGGTYNAGSYGFDRTEAKLETFNAVGFSEVRLGLEYPIGSGNIGWLVLPLGASSLQSLFQQQIATAIGPAAWQSALPGSLLQPYCNAEGTNQGNSYARVRIGIVANQENDCDSPDSFIGIGGADAGQCGFGPPSTGNQACYMPDSSTSELDSFGWIFVR